MVFFKFERRHSVTDMLCKLGLPSFDEYYHACIDRMCYSWMTCAYRPAMHLYLFCNCTNAIVY